LLGSIKRQSRANSTLPGWRLHPLKGDLAGYWSITVSANWRIIFRFEQSDATDLDLIDYH
jgi:toxin HigB-1